MAATQVHVGPGMIYTPPTISIKVGGTVQWIWDEGNHSTTSVDGLWDSGVLNAGQTFDYTFANAGSFDYYCTVHGPSMTGTVTVTN